MDQIKQLSSSTQNTQKPSSQNNAYQGLTDKEIYGRERYSRYSGDRHKDTTMGNKDTVANMATIVAEITI